MAEPPLVDSIFHATDFSEASHQAFAHALAIALARKCDLTILHSGRDFLAEDEWGKFPAVRRTLEGWGQLQPGRERSALLEELDLRVQKVNLRRLSPRSAILDYIEGHETDLVVIATEGREGIPGWLRPSVAEKVARRSQVMTLFVPEAGQGFVDPASGATRLGRILVPVAHVPSAEPASVYAGRAASLASGPVEIVFLHVGEGEMPKLHLPEDPHIAIREERRQGDVLDTIERYAREHDVDLIAMTTDGRDGILGALGRGSHTEQVVRRVDCPVLSVPVGYSGAR